jgi:hypothetical protein
VERGVPLAQVRDLLGHASILTTERYDNQTLESLQAAAAKLEGVSASKCRIPRIQGRTFTFSFKKTHSDIRKAPTNMPVRPSANRLPNPEFEEWLAGIRAKSR